MDEGDIQARIQALVQLLNELRVRVDALAQRIATAEQSMQQRWISSGS